MLPDSFSGNIGSEWPNSASNSLFIWFSVSQSEALFHGQNRQSDTVKLRQPNAAHEHDRLLT